MCNVSITKVGNIFDNPELVPVELIYAFGLQELHYDYIKSLEVGDEFRYYYGTQDNMYFTDSAINAGLVYTTDVEARCRLSERMKK